MLASPGDFIDVVVKARDLIVTDARDHTCRIEPRNSQPGWFCDLYDGTPTTNENGPASHVRWVCPKFRIVGSETPAHVLDVRRLGPKSDLDRLVGALDHQIGLSIAVDDRLDSSSSR